MAARGLHDRPGDEHFAAAGPRADPGRQVHFPPVVVPVAVEDGPVVQPDARKRALRLQLLEADRPVAQPGGIGAHDHHRVADRLEDPGIVGQAVGLTFGTPSEAADQNAFAVTQEFADGLGVTTLSELADACGDGSLVLGGPAECPTRPFCQPGLEETYGLQFDGFRELDTGGPLTKAALQQGEISIGLVFSSDGALAQS